MKSIHTERVWRVPSCCAYAIFLCLALVNDKVYTGTEAGRLYLLFVREQPFMTEQDSKRKWPEDAEASAVFGAAKQQATDVTPLFCYAVSPSAAETIVDIAATIGASRLILAAPKRNALINLLRGNVIREVSNLLPEEIDLLAYA